MPGTGLWKSVGRVLDRAVDATGTLTGLITIAGFGISALGLGPTRAVWAALAVFGLVGAVEVFHRQRNAEAVQRRQLADPNGLFFAALSTKKWRHKILKELTHGGFRWQVLGFEEVKLPFGISAPQCPSCEELVFERVEVRFPGRLRIRVQCTCGFSTKSKYTLAELRREAAEIANLPR